MTTHVEIEPSRDEERSDLFAFAKGAFGEQSGWSDRRALEGLEQDAVFVARVEDSIAGYVALRAEATAMRVEQLLVAPHHEGEGVGHRLLEYAEGYAISRGSLAVRVVVEDGNERAIAFYRRCGFVPVGQQLYELTLPIRA